MRKVDFGSSNIPLSATWEMHSQEMREQLGMLLQVRACPAAAGRALLLAVSHSGEGCSITMGSATDFCVFFTPWLNGHNGVVFPGNNLCYLEVLEHFSINCTEVTK